MYKKLALASFALFFAVFVTGCDSAQSPQQVRTSDIVNDKLASSLRAIKTLKQKLEDPTPQLPNAIIVHKYSKWIKQNKPDFADVAELIEKEATPQAKAIKDKQDELVEASRKYHSYTQPSRALEQETLEKAIRVKEFESDYNNILLDSVNVLAGLSDGKLPKFDIPDSNPSEKTVPMSEYVGNPSYGTWKQDNSGHSFWEWYGMYSMFNNIFATPVYRSSWYGHYGGYSYFDRYGSSYERPTWNSGYHTYYKDSKYLSSHPSAFKNVKIRGRIKNSAFVSSRRANAVARSSSTRSFSSSASKISSTSRTSRNTSSFRSRSRSSGFGGRSGK